ncbi:hypothetical protein WG66_000764 [Moniliophthora roreri]|nr:hypothetical protein WG66_000764 [Moniliophthora roreri]
MTFVTATLFATSTALWSMNLAVLFIAIRGFFTKYPNLSLYNRFVQLDFDILPFSLPMEALFMSNMIIGDAVVIWRAWILCKNSWLQTLVYIPMVTLLVSFASGYGIESSAIPEGSKVCQWGEAIAWGISLLTNVISTTLIATRTWQYRMFLHQGNSQISSQSQRIMVILVESGFAYCLFWLSQLVLFFQFDNDTPGAYVYAFLSTMGDQISGVYPTIIIILVYLQRSISDATTIGKLSNIQDMNTGGGTVTHQLSTLQCATGHADSSFTSSGPDISESDVTAKVKLQEDENDSV